MSIKLAVSGGPALLLNEEYITLGTDPGCTLSFAEAPNVKPKHAVIHLVAGRWLIEVRQAESIFVGSSEPKKTHWLNSGDVIQLVPNGPDIKFFSTETDAPVAAMPPKMDLPPVAQKPSKYRGGELSNSPKVAELPPLFDESSLQEDEVFRLASDAASPANSDHLVSSDHLVPAAKPVKSSSSTSKTPKPPSSEIIPTLKTPESADPGGKRMPPSTKRSGDPPSSKTLLTVDTPTSESVPVAKSPSSATIKTTSSSSSGSMRTSKTPKTQKRSDANVPTSGSGKKGSRESIATQGARDPEAKLPVLKRIKSWEGPAPDFADEDFSVELDGTSNLRRKKSGNQADIQFIQSVAIRCLAVVVGLIILWHVFQEIVKAMNTPKVGSISWNIESSNREEPESISNRDAGAAAFGNAPQAQNRWHA